MTDVSFCGNRHLNELEAASGGLPYTPRRNEHESRNMIAHADDCGLFLFPAARLVLARGRPVAAL